MFIKEKFFFIRIIRRNVQVIINMSTQFFYECIYAFFNTTAKQIQLEPALGISLS